MPVKVSIIILTYNNAEDIKGCLTSIFNQTYRDYEVIVVDNASADATTRIIKDEFPKVKLIETKRNLGYATGNNIGVRSAHGQYIAVLNPDTEVDEQWLSELVGPMELNPRIGISTPKILMFGTRDSVNSCGNMAHFTGLHFCRGLDFPSNAYYEPEYVPAVSGCSFLMRRSLFDKLGGFDDDFFLYLEDDDLSWRTRFSGYHLLYVPTSIVFHKYKLTIASWKYFYLERNRYLILLKHLSLRFIILMLPALLLTEIVTLGHATLSGRNHLKSKVRAYRWILHNRGHIRGKRREIRKNLRVGEREFVGLLDWEIPFDQIIKNKSLARLAHNTFNPLYHLNYRLLRALL